VGRGVSWLKPPHVGEQLIVTSPAPCIRSAVPEQQVIAATAFSTTA